MRLLAVSLLALHCSALRLPSATRRATLLGGAAAALAPPLVAHADGGDWAAHSGPFTDETFKDFKKGKIDGFLFKVISPGAGDPPQVLQKAYIDYNAYTLDGKRIASTYADGKAFDFRINGKKVGRGSRSKNDEAVLDGVENVVAGMKPGMKVVVRIPSNLAYGAAGDAALGVPPNAPLVYYLELVKLGGIKGDAPKLGWTDD